MKQISRDDVLHLARLSNLQLSDDEIGTLQNDLAEIISYIEQLGELDMSGVDPTYQVTGLTNVWREDVVNQGSISREQLLSLAPESQENSVKVPKVL